MGLKTSLCVFAIVVASCSSPTAADSADPSQTSLDPGVEASYTWQACRLESAYLDPEEIQVRQVSFGHGDPESGEYAAEHLSSVGSDTESRVQFVARDEQVLERRSNSGLAPGSFVLSSLAGRASSLSQ